MSLCGKMLQRLSNYLIWRTKILIVDSWPQSNRMHAQYIIIMFELDSTWQKFNV